MVKVLVYADMVKDALEAIGAAQTLGGEIHLTLSGEAAEKYSEVAGGASSLALIKGETTDEIAGGLIKVYDTVSPDLVIAVSTKNVKDILSRLAAEKNLPLAIDSQEVSLENGKLQVKRNIMSGRATATLRYDLPAAITLPPRKFKPATPTGSAPAPTTVEAGPAKVKILGRKEKQRGAVDLESAEIIVSVGRGFKKKEDLKLAFELAEVLGAQIGCSRPIAADLQWLGEEHWVGLSGKKVAPQAYIAIGISGAPQHIAGILDAKIVVAINKDKSAPIFKAADYGVVADLYKFVPVLVQKLKEKKGA